MHLYGNRQLSGVHWLVSLAYLQRLRQVREPRRDPVSSKRGKKCEERHPRLCSGLYLHEHTCGCTHLHPYSLPYMHGYMHVDINTHNTYNYKYKIVFILSLFHCLPYICTLYIVWSFPQACFCQLAKYFCIAQWGKNARKMTNIDLL